MTNTKVYLEIVKKLREMIFQDGLKSGDKIPSERELSERLNAGRSSVREALRALELLGLIETRRGEGTFIRDFRGNQLVQILSTFILQDEKAKSDVVETKYLIEMDCLRLASKRMNQDIVIELKRMLDSGRLDEASFFYRILEVADNHLLSRIWVILKDYYLSLNFEQVECDKTCFTYLLNALEEKDEEKTLIAYRKLRNLSISTDKN